MITYTLILFILSYFCRISCLQRETKHISVSVSSISISILHGLFFTEGLYIPIYAWIPFNLENRKKVSFYIILDTDAKLLFRISIPVDR